MTERGKNQKNALSSTKDGMTFRIDLREMESPAPLVTTLRELENLPEEAVLEGLYPKTPIHLFPHLVENGWQWSIIREDQEGTLLKIFRKPPCS